MKFITTFKPKLVDDKLVTPYIRKDGELSKRGLTDEEYNKMYNYTEYESIHETEVS